MDIELKDISEPESITKYISEHEFMLSFNNDEDRYAFDAWWHGHGKHAFIKWAKEFYD